MIKKIAIISASWLCSISAVHAQGRLGQDQPFVLGRIDELSSSILSETRKLNIYLPEGYQQDSSRIYPVIYLLDGSADEDFIHVAGIIQFLNFPWVDKLPKSILVGVANVDRKRDFTFPTQNKKDKEASPGSGQSGAFINFIEKELVPYIQSHYKVSPRRTIIGESLGGLLATEILLKKPDLFNDYIIISPSLWWNDESLLKDAGKWLKAAHYRNTQVYLSIGNEGQQMARDAAQLESLLKKASLQGLRVFSYNFPDESHATIFHLSLYKAFVLMNRKN